jgi:hypothetical protein
MKVEDKILNYLKVSGPSLPIRVAKNIKEDGLITSAYLSDLASQRKVKISKLKIGSSPLYYLPGDESQLMNYTDGINSKDLNVLHRLQNEKVIREDGQELLTKVALRNLKDFAYPLHVTSQKGKEIFWKWYLLNDEETNQRITLLLGGNPAPKVPLPEQTEANLEQVNQAQEPAPIISTQETINHGQNDQPQSYPPNTTIAQEQETLQSYPPNTANVEPQIQETTIPIQHEVPVIKKKEEVFVAQKEEIIPEPIAKEQKTEPVTKEVIKEEKENIPEKQAPKKPEKQKSLVTKIKEKIVGKKKSSSQDSFIPIIHSYFKELDIDILEHEIVRKNSEVDFSLKVPSVVGRLNYYCKAKNKNKCDEKDISAAYMQAQISKRPLLFLYTGMLSKKAQEMLESDAFVNAIIKRIE